MSENENYSNEWGQQPQNITVSPNITVQSNANRVFEVVGTLLGCGALGMIAYALAEYGWLEVAATGLTMFAAQWIRLMASSGVMPFSNRSKSDEEEDFAKSKGIIKTFMADLAAWQAKSPMWRLAGLALLYTVIFMIARSCVSIALTVFASPWIAGAAAMLVAMVIIGPDQIIRLVKKIKGQKGSGGDAGVTA